MLAGTYSNGSNEITFDFDKSYLYGEFNYSYIKINDIIYVTDLVNVYSYATNDNFATIYEVENPQNIYTLQSQ